MREKTGTFASRAWPWLLYGIVGVGVMLRVVVFLHNRSLISDEANVARNLFEQGYLGLLRPLNYGTYAPPVFLWILKAMVSLFGYSEFSLRVYPLLGGLLSLWVMLLILKKLVTDKGVWYPLLLLASGEIYIRYATETKQYATDVLVILVIIIMALYTDIRKQASLKFFLVWSIAGSLAIWFSMPAVFMLAGVGAYFLYRVMPSRSGKLKLLAAVGLVWAAQFMLYYCLFLNKAIQSDYLQTWHKDYFLFLFPDTLEKVTHDLGLFADILTALGGKTVLAISFHVLLIFGGAFLLFRRDKAYFLLFITPVLLLIVAVGLHKFTLLPRVCLFIFPILLLLMGVCMDRVLQIRNKAVAYPTMLIAAICLVNFSQLRYLSAPYEKEEFKKGMELVLREKIDGHHFYVNSLVRPVYIYYTEIHPDREKWSILKGAGGFGYGMNNDSIAATLSGRNALIYEWIMDYELRSELQSCGKYCRIDTSISYKGGSVYFLSKR